MASERDENEEMELEAWYQCVNCGSMHQEGYCPVCEDMGWQPSDEIVYLGGK